MSRTVKGRSRLHRVFAAFLRGVEGCEGCSQVAVVGGLRTLFQTVWALAMPLTLVFTCPWPSKLRFSTETPEQFDELQNEIMVPENAELHPVWVDLHAWMVVPE